MIEHQQKGRTNAFVDNRFGEADEGMPLEDKLVHRFQRERQRQLKASKASRYSLGDGDGAYDDAAGGYAGGALGAPTQLTHGGRALGDMEDLSDADLGDSDDEAGRGRRDDGFEGADFVKRAHFGGGENDDDGVDGGGRRLSAKELLEETIAKYKLAKYERQEKKREENDQIAALDEEFDAIRGLVFQAGSKEAAKAKGAAKASSSPPPRPMAARARRRTPISKGWPPRCPARGRRSRRSAADGGGARDRGGAAAADARGGVATADATRRALVRRG